MFIVIVVSSNIRSQLGGDGIINVFSLIQC